MSDQEALVRPEAVPGKISVRPPRSKRSSGGSTLDERPRVVITFRITATEMGTTLVTNSIGAALFGLGVNTLDKWMDLPESAPHANMVRNTWFALLFFGALMIVLQGIIFAHIWQTSKKLGD